MKDRDLICHFLGFVLSFSIIYPKVTKAQNLLQSQDSLDILEFDLGKHGQFWVDSFSQLNTFEEITLQQFSQLNGFELGSTKHAYWAKIKLNNTQNISAEYWLHLGVFDSLTLLQQTAGQIEVHQRGLMVDYDASQKQQFRSLRQHKYGLAISIPPKTSTTLFLRIKNVLRFETSIGSVEIREINRQLSDSARKMIGFSIFNTVFLGILLFLIAFSLSKYVQSKGISYVYYAIYLSLTICYFWWKLEKSNAFFDVFFTAFPEHYYYYEALLVVLIYVSYVLFVSHFLNAKEELPIFYKILRLSTPFLFSYFGLSILISVIWGLSIGWEWIYWIRIVLIPMGILSIYLVFKAKHQLGFYILTGTLLMLLGAAITTYLSKALINHFVGPWDLPLLPIQLGMLAETLFFAAGLQYKNHLVEQEKTKMLMELKQQQKEAEFSQKRKEDLTRLYANLSHESRTPITIILGALQQIKGHRKERNLIYRNGQQLLNLINQILDINKVVANKMQPNWKQGDIMRYIRYCAESFEVLAQKQSQSFEVSCVPHQLIMDFDAEKLQRILNNLLANAIKFTPVHGQIRVEAYQEVKDDKAIFQLKVSDSGPGIPPAFQALIFDPYIQLPDTKGGSGLGLSLVKEFGMINNWSKVVDTFFRIGA